jgi:hypothetical protein
MSGIGEPAYVPGLVFGGWKRNRHSLRLNMNAVGSMMGFSSASTPDWQNTQQRRASTRYALWTVAAASVGDCCVKPGIVNVLESFVINLTYHCNLRGGGNFRILLV